MLAILLAATSAGAQTWPSLSAPLPKAGGGEGDAAVVIAIEAYAFLAPIPGAAQNGADWVDWLVRVRGVPSSKLRLLSDRQATRERIEQELALAAAAAEGGTVWAIFIGHGAPSADGTDGLFLGADTQPELESLGARGVAQQQIVQRISSSPTASSSLVVFDASFSGRTHDGAVALVAGLEAAAPVRPSEPPAATVLSSSDTFAGSLPGVARPALSYLLLGALRGWGDGDHDGSVTIDEAFTFAREALATGPRGAERLPSRRGGDGGLVVALDATEEAPDVSAILLGRCPNDARWSGRRCEARSAADAAPLETTSRETAPAVVDAAGGATPRAHEQPRPAPSLATMVAVGLSVTGAASLAGAVWFGLASANANAKIQAGGYATGGDIAEAAESGEFANAATGVLIAVGAACLGAAAATMLFGMRVEEAS